MKCIRLTSSKKVLRVNDQYADILVQEGIAVFVSKDQWKKDGKNYLEKGDIDVLNQVSKVQDKT